MTNETYYVLRYNKNGVIIPDLYFASREAAEKELKRVGVKDGVYAVCPYTPTLSCQPRPRKGQVRS